MSWKVVAVLLVLIGGLAFAAGWRSRPTPGPIYVDLPPKTITLEVVKEIEVPGPERVVERVRWKTERVEVPVEVVQIVRELVREDRSILGDVQVNAAKYEGINPETGKLAQGWAGEAICSIAPVMDDGEPGPWLEIVSQPFDYQTSTAVSVVPPTAHVPYWEKHPRRTELRLGATTAPGVAVGLSRYGKRRLGWFAEATVDFQPEEFTTYQSTGEIDLFTRERAESVRVAAGLAFSFGRR